MPEIQNANHPELTRLAPRRLAMAMAAAELMVMGAGGWAVYDAQTAAAAPTSCIEQECGSTALHDVMLAPLVTDRPAKVAATPLVITRPLPRSTTPEAQSPAPKAAASPSPEVPAPLLHSTPLNKLFSALSKVAAKPSLPPLHEHELAVKRPAKTGIIVDVSYPQCQPLNPQLPKADLPARADYILVGVNHGRPQDTNTCLARMLVWAVQAADKVELYFNTSNPGVSNPREHGRQLAAADLERVAIATREAHALDARVSTDITHYGTAWLDVETPNTWQYGSPAALTSNEQVLEGMTERFKQAGLPVGIYTANSLKKGLNAVDPAKPAYSQFHRIVGNVPPGSNLNGLPAWVATGEGGIENAIPACDFDPITPTSTVIMTQYGQDGLDHNYLCPPR